MNNSFKNIYSKKLLGSIIGFYLFYIIVLAILYLSQNDIADFLLARGHDFSSYNDISVVSLLLGIVMNTFMYMFYIFGLWLTLAVKKHTIRLILLLLPIGLLILIVRETSSIYFKKEFYSDNVFWIEFSIRGILYFLMLLIIFIVNKNNIKST